MKLILQQLNLSRLKHVQDQQYEVRVPGNRENSPSPPASRRRAANDSWKVENLDVRSVETQNPRNNSEGCEGICRNFRLSIRQPIQNSRLANTGEADENDCRVATLANLESWTSSLRGRGFQLLVQPGKLGFEKANVMFSFLVDLGLLHLLLYLLNLLWKTHSGTLNPSVDRRGLVNVAFQPRIGSWAMER